MVFWTQADIYWKTHINQLVPEQKGARYAAGIILHVSNTDSIRSVYFAYFHSLMKYGIIFWGNSSDRREVL
jgi:hypothetical protein